MAEHMDLVSMPGLTESDRENLAQGDERFQPNTWDELKHIIGSTVPFHYFCSSPYSTILQLQTILVS